MAARRASVLLIVLLTAIGLGTLLLQVLAPGGWTPAKLVDAGRLRRHRAVDRPCAWPMG